MDGIPSQHLRQVKTRGRGKVKTPMSGLLPEMVLRGISQSQFHGETLDLNTDPSYLYPGKPTDPDCPVPKHEYLRKEDQQLYMQWIEQILDIDRRTSKAPRLYCAYCDMNNHPRFTCKHAYKHQKENEKPVPSMLHLAVLKVQVKLSSQCVQPQL